jgi:CO/xanthine dehydrogenase Mo-binding subunit
LSEERKRDYYLSGIPVPETPEKGEKPGPWGKTSVIGKRMPRVDAYDRVSGSAVYPSDVVIPGMTYGAILRCPYPNAIVKSVDTSRAEKMPGVVAVISGSSREADVQWPYSKDTRTKLFDPHCRFEGEEVAAAAADTPYHAWDAVRAIKAEYEVLPFNVEEERALQAGVPPVHPGGNRVTPRETYKRGDVGKGFAEADVVREREFHTECEIHTPMELHGCVASWDGKCLTIWESTQGVYAVQSMAAQVLGLPLSRVRVIGHYMGGAFGSKLQAGKYTVIAALLARKSGRPVKLFLSREETYLCVGNRPPAHMSIKAGVKKDGTLTALDFSAVGTGGAYPAGGTGLLDWLVKDLYLCPNVRTEMQDVYINSGPSRPFRAPGHPQCSWALEQIMDELADAIGMDPVELRLRNIPSYSQGRTGNPPYTTTGLRECLEEGSKAFGWKEARRKGKGGGHIRRGVGMAAALWAAGGGRPPSTIIIKLFSDGSVNLNMGASDIGTGTKTVMAMVISEELGVKPDLIQIENADTGTTQYATPSGGSKTVPTEAPAVRAAAISVKRQLLEMAAEDLRLDPADLLFEGNEIVSKNDPAVGIGITSVQGLKKRGVVVGVGYRGPNPEHRSINPFAAQFCEVEVDMKTGEVRIIRFLGAHESGRVMNRLTFDTQVYGGITMGIGFGMSEVRILDEGQTGKVLTRNWHDYKLPTALDVPAGMVSSPVEIDDDEANTTGAKGLGEPVTIPTAAAIANAVFNATGIRIVTTPMDPLNLVGPFAGGRKERQG